MAPDATLHLLAGSLALVAAPLALVVRKGGRWHRRWGRVFVYAMVVVCISAIWMAWHKANYLMILVAVFSLHLCGSGWRALYLKRLHKGQLATWVDWALHGTAGLFNAGLLIWGVSGLLLKHDTSPFYIIFTVFGGIGSWMVVRQAGRFMKRAVDRDQWFFDHITGMLAGYIATVSAFSAVNIEFMPAALRWLWPTLVGTPAIVLTIRYYRSRLNEHRRPHDIAKVKIDV
ncbi:MAG: DUF2306 domain-containing protein [Flavobacteriales bacterium]|nr:DUF2306 domain-containing protein [Flavobacteriales bacterium]